IPRDGERHLENGEPFRIEGFHEGVRVAWESSGTMTVSEKDGHRIYTGSMPDEVVYHQRRNAFRAALKLAQLVNIEIG
ncbi:flagellar brake protein, partial [Klebsiella quasipneumoniae]